MYTQKTKGNGSGISIDLPDQIKLQRKALLKD
jgi:hypothetical protein